MNATAAQLNVDSATGLEINLAIAGPGARSYAFIIDWHIRFLVAIAWWVGASFLLTGTLTLTALRDAVGDWLNYTLITVLPAAVIYFLYHPILEIAMHGRTPGKRMAGVRIVTRAGLTPGTGALLIRNAFRLVDALPGFYCVGLVVAFFTRESVRIGDLAAGTVLVYDRIDSRSDKEDFTADFAQGRVAPHLAELIDDVLNRWSELEPAMRVQLAQKLLSRLDPQATTLSNERELKQQLQNYRSS